MTTRRYGLGTRRTYANATSQLGARITPRRESPTFPDTEDVGAVEDGATIVAMRLSRRADHAVHALIELAAAGETLVPAEQLAQEQAIPGKMLGAVMTELRRAGLVRTQRGPDEGFSLARPAAEISLAEVVRVIDAL